jgi:hypothetical protein
MFLKPLYVKSINFSLIYCLKSSLIFKVLAFFLSSGKRESGNYADLITQISTLILVDLSGNLLAGTTYHEESNTLFVSEVSIPSEFELGNISFQSSTLKII